MKYIKNLVLKQYGTLRFLSIALITVTVSSACMKGPSEEPELQSAVNVVNGTIGTNPLVFYINKQKVEGTALSYTQESGYFITLPGTRDFDVANDGSADYLIRSNVTLKQNTYHTIFLTGEANTLGTFVTTDDLENPPSGKAKIRFANLSPDGGPLVVARKNGADIFTQQDYKTASAFITLDPGSYDLVLKTATGTVLAEQNIGVVSGKIYSLWAKGMRSGVSNAPIGLQFRSIN